MGHLQLIEITEGKNVATTTITINGTEVNAVHECVVKLLPVIQEKISHLPN
jgi:hypothetical protein